MLNSFCGHLGVGTSRLLAFLILALANQTFAADDVQSASARGAALWAAQCDRCHNMRDPVEFRDDQWRVVVAHMRVRAGLSGHQSADILAFLQTSNSAVWDQVPGTTDDVKDAVQSGSLGPSARDLYSRSCIACHGDDGRGAIAGVPDLTSQSGPLRQPDADLQRSILTGVRNPKSPLVMPPKGGDPSLTDEDARQLVQFLREEFGQPSPTR